MTKLLTLNGIDVVGVLRFDGDWIKSDVANFTFVEALIPFAPAGKAGISLGFYPGDGCLRRVFLPWGGGLAYQYEFCSIGA